MAMMEQHLSTAIAVITVMQEPPDLTSKPVQLVSITLQVLQVVRV